MEDKTDFRLGAEVHAHLKSLGLETIDPDQYSPEEAFAALVKGINRAYYYLGLDVENDPSIKDTPKRFAKMFVGELTKGLNYDFFPKCTAIPNGVSPEQYDIVGGQIENRGLGAVNEMVVIDKILAITLCEHHLQTISGYVHIGYVPGPKLLGLSKFARVVEFFAARPQVQERMTEQVFAALSLILETNDVAVVMKASHNCMRARGVKQPASETTTSKLGGRFMSNGSLREEFLHAIAR